MFLTNYTIRLFINNKDCLYFIKVFMVKKSFIFNPLAKESPYQAQYQFVG